MSQRECAGFNWPPLSIPALEPVSVTPEAVSRAGPHSATCCVKGIPESHGLGGNPPRFASVVVGDTQPANQATRPSSAFNGTFGHSPPSFQSRVAGVGHEVDPLPDVRSTDARSRDTDSPEGVVDSFHVSLNKVEPTVPNRCFNLLTKDDRRAALLDEEVPVGPKVPLVVKSSTKASCAERLARTRAGPDLPIVRPAGASQGVRPDTNACEKVALAIPGKVVRADIKNAPFIYEAGSDVPRGDKVSQPLGRVGVDLVVVGALTRHEACPSLR